MSITFGAAALPEPDAKWLAAAERLPIESIWQGGHVLPPTGTGEAITRLALMTAWTERVRVGTAILLLPLYQPVLVAKQLADLDSRSGGRTRIRSPLNPPGSQRKGARLTCRLPPRTAPRCRPGCGRGR